MIQTQGTTNWQAFGGVSVFSGPCSEYYIPWGTGSFSSPTLHKYSTYVRGIANLAPVTEATLQIRNGANAMNNFTITVLYHGSDICTTNADNLPPACTAVLPTGFSTYISPEYNVITANTYVERFIEHYDTIFPDEVSQNSTIYKAMLEQVCRRFVPKCTAIGTDTELYPCRRRCYEAALAAGKPGAAAEVMCNTVDVNCVASVYYPMVADPPVLVPPPESPPTDPPTSPPTTPPPEDDGEIPPESNSEGPMAPSTDTNAPVSTPLPPVHSPSQNQAPNAPANGQVSGVSQRTATVSALLVALLCALTF